MIGLPKDFTDAKKPQLFDGLTESSVQKLLACSIIQEYDASKILVQQGDTPEGIYVVIEGALKTLRLNEDGEDRPDRETDREGGCGQGKRGFLICCRGHGVFPSKYSNS